MFLRYHNGRSRPILFVSKNSNAVTGFDFFAGAMLGVGFMYIYNFQFHSTLFYTGDAQKCPLSRFFVTNLFRKKISASKQYVLETNFITINNS